MTSTETTEEGRYGRNTLIDPWTEHGSLREHTGQNIPAERRPANFRELEEKEGKRRRREERESRRNSEQQVQKSGFGMVGWGGRIDQIFPP